MAPLKKLPSVSVQQLPGAMVRGKFLPFLLVIAYVLFSVVTKGFQRPSNFEGLSNRLANTGRSLRDGNVFIENPRQHPRTDDTLILPQPNSEDNGRMKAVFAANVATAGSTDSAVDKTRQKLSYIFKHLHNVTIPRVTKQTIAIVTAVGNSKTGGEYYDSKTFTKFSGMVLSNFYTYAQKHGYPLYVLNANLAKPERQFYWLKKDLIQHYFEKGFEWVFYTDIDFLFLNHTKPLEEFIKPDKHIIAGRECLPKAPRSKIMSGTFMLRNSEIGWRLLDEWEGLYQKYRTTWNSDQNAFEELTMYPNSTFKPFIEKLEPNNFMQYPKCTGKPDIYMSRKRYFGIHFPGENKTELLPPWYKEWAKTLAPEDRHSQYLDFVFKPCC